MSKIESLSAVRWPRFLPVALLVMTVAGGMSARAADEIRLASDAYVLDDDVGNMDVLVLLQGTGLGEVSVDYATQDGTAKAGVDYAAASGTLTFRNGCASQRIRIPILYDHIFKGMKTLTLSLSNPTGGAVLGDPSVATLAIVGDESGPRVLFVDAAVSPGGDGSSWAAAYMDLQDALASATGPAEIWVARGTYTPDRGSGDRKASFWLADNIGIYGGFAGWETSRKQRDLKRNLTVLSGDLKGDDGSEFARNHENSLHVVTARFVNAMAILDGFTVIGGNATGTAPDMAVGGGMLCSTASPTIRNCTFARNTAIEAGGLFNDRYAGPTLVSCIFLGNVAACGERSGSYGGGGGMKNSASGALLQNCIFIGNVSHGEGGAIFSTSGSPILSRCTLLLNVASFGGALATQGYATRNSPTFYDSVLASNVSMSEQVFTSEQGTPGLSIVNCNVQGGREGLLRSLSLARPPVWGEGNTDTDVLTTPDGHLRCGSPAIDFGARDYGSAIDVDGELRPEAALVDLGADEFVDQDEDALPDWWEALYFGDPTAADPNDDPDGDGLANLDEYGLYSSDPIRAPYHVDGTRVGDPLADGSSSRPLGTIQAGLDAAQDGDTVLVAPGTYTGTGNFNLDFHGKAVVLHAMGGSDSTTIDCNGLGRAFYFHSDETARTVVIGFTIINGREALGAAIRCERASPQIRNCVLMNNTGTRTYDSALACSYSHPTLADCAVMGNSPRGVSIDHGGVHIVGTVEIASNDAVGFAAALTGNGTLKIHSDSRLHLYRATICCNLSGTGTIKVDSSEITINGNADINLGDNGRRGRIECDGLLNVKGSVRIRNADIYVHRVRFEGDVDISNSVISAEAGAPFGQFYVAETVRITNCDIYSDGDRYIDLDPAVFKGIIAQNRIFVTVTEGQNSTRGGLLELRGKDGLAASSCKPTDFFCQVAAAPSFDTRSWTIERLELADGAKVNLTNRFDFGNGGSEEVMYVKDLRLGRNSVLNTAFNRLYYETLVGDPNSVVNIPLLGFSLGNIACNSAVEFTARIAQNSTWSRPHVELVVGQPPDPQGMMQMQNLREPDHRSPFYGQVVNACAKGLFDKSSEHEILVRFEYLFRSSSSDAELVVYLSDVPELLAVDDPGRPSHYLEVGRVYPPPPGRPGALNSGRFGIFEKVVSIGTLNFMRGTRVELELIGPDGACVWINNWDPGIRCSSRCGDVAGSFRDQINAVDWLAVMSECGRPVAEVEPVTGCTATCLDSLFFRDGIITIDDAMAIDCYAEGSCVCSSPPAPLHAPSPAPASHSHGISVAAGETLDWEEAPIVILGKRYDASEPADFLGDRLYGLDEDYAFVGKSIPKIGQATCDRLNGRLVHDCVGALYQLHLVEGLIEVSTGDVLVPPGSSRVAREPLYLEGATVHVGFKAGSVLSAASLQRPIVDAAFIPNAPNDPSIYVYVAPVVVEPDGYAAYKAVAKLRVHPHGTPPYDVVQLYGLTAPNDNIVLDGLREMEVDGMGNLYVVNAGRVNESDMLWICDRDAGQARSLSLMNQVNGPTALHVSDSGILFLASLLNEPDASSSQLYWIPTDDLLGASASPKAPEFRHVTIHGMGHISGIAEDTTKHTLYVVGFTMRSIPTEGEIQNDAVLKKAPFYKPYMAKVAGRNLASVDAVPLTDPKHDLALPLSVVWHGR